MNKVKIIIIMSLSLFKEQLVGLSVRTFHEPALLPKGLSCKYSFLPTCDAT